jgi:hypothetical protein
MKNMRTYSLFIVSLFSAKIAEKEDNMDVISQMEWLIKPLSVTNIRLT